MRLAVSNIAWSEAEDPDVAPRLLAAGAEAIEIAPGRVFDDPAAAGPQDSDRVRALWEGRGLPLASMQALLFGKGDLRLFGDAAQTEAFAAYLEHVVALAGRMGCGPLVFGSPRNRARGELDVETATARAVPVFRRIGDAAASAGCVFCLEPNAVGYGCDYMTVLAEAAEVVRRIDHPAVGLVADTGNMRMMDEPPEALAEVAPLVRHLHLSEPQLAPLDAGSQVAARAVETMRAAGYDGSVTVEMRRVERDPLGAVETALRAARAWLEG